MRLVTVTQRIARFIATEQRRVNIGLSTTMGFLLDLLEASLGLSGRSTGKKYPSPSHCNRLDYTDRTGNRIYANLRPAPVFKHCDSTTTRNGQ
jgi:hypothetical protein